MRFPDDEWREILEASGFTPSGATEEVWRNPHNDLKVKIDVDSETEEPYYQIITEDGSRSAKWSDSDTLKKIVEPKEPEPPKLTPEEEKEGDEKFLRSMGIIAKVSTEQKLAGRPPRFSFSVPMQASGHVAFQLAKAGMKDFEVKHYKEDEFSTFTFPSEPEMHVAEELIKAEFADQIASRKGYWGTWSDVQDPTQVKGERELNPPRQYVSSVRAAWLAREMGKIAGQWGERSWDSDQVHDILDKYRNDYTKSDYGKNLSFDNPVPKENLPALLTELNAVSDEETYLGVVVFLVTHGSNVPMTYRMRACQMAIAMTENEEYLQGWADPVDRKSELLNEISLLQGRGTKTSHTAHDAPYTGDQVYRKLLPKSASYNFTNKGWLMPNGKFHGWSNINTGHNEVAEKLLHLEGDPEGNIALGDDAAADQGWVAVSNDGVNVMFTFKRLDRSTIDLLRSAMVQGKFPAKPLITLSNSGFGQPREIHKDFDNPEQVEEWLSNL